MDGSGVVTEIFMLYELSMAIGNSLVFEENCHDFLNALMAKKELDNTWLFEKKAKHFQLSYSIPQDHKLIDLGFNFDNFISPASIDPGKYPDVFDQFGLQGGALAMFPLFHSGFLVLYSKKREVFSTKELNQLAPLAKKFGISLEGSKVHEASVSQKDELDRLYGELSETNNQLMTEILIRKDSEESLKLAKQKAEDSLEFKQRFLANMSHEIRTPMNGILGMSKLLQSADLDKKNKTRLDSIRSSAKNLLVIINDILDLSKIESGKLELEEIGFDLKKMLGEIISSVEYLAAEKDLVIDREVPPELEDLVMIGDPVRLGQILTNLVSNGIKFTQQGKVSISCKLIDPQRIEFSVSDTGIGIPEEKLKTIFNSFSQADSSTTRKFGGTGLGLTISKQLVELHKGKLHVNSIEGIGTRFHFSIPFRRGSMEDLPVSKRTAPGKLDVKGLNILLVEDNKINQVYAMSVLEEEGMDLVLAENGLEAIELLRDRHDFDVILMDIQMPIMGGEEATQIIRTELKLSTPIIALTANALNGEMEKYLDCGMDAYVSKPFDDTELVSVIARLTDRQHKAKPAAKQDVVEEERLYSLSKLERIFKGKQPLIDNMIDKFVEQVPKDMNLLLEASRDKDYARIGSIAHKMKSSLDVMGVEKTYHTIRSLEKHAQSKTNVEEIPGWVKEIETTLTQLFEQLKRV